MGKSKFHVIENKQVNLRDGQAGHATQEMLKMKIDPTMCMKTRVGMTKCHSKMHVFTQICASFAAFVTHREGVCQEMSSSGGGGADTGHPSR